MKINRYKYTEGSAHMKSSKTKKRKTFSNISCTKAVGILFVISFSIRMLLNYLVIAAPVVSIDESLYTNIARSIAAGKGVTYRLQPIDYPYLLYPILLVPVYWLHRFLGGDLYRYVQLFNSLLITSSVFPIFLLTRSFSQNDKKALAVSAATVLMPDMIMGGYEMSECLIWPLAMWVLYFGYLLLKGEKPLAYGFITAFITALMYETKPGAVALGAVFLSVHCIYVIKNKRRKAEALIPILVLAVLLGAFIFLGNELTKVSKSAIGLYEKQLSNWNTTSALVAIEGTLLILFLFCFACGAVYAFLPIFFFRKYQPDQRRFIIAFYLGLLTLIIGTGIFIVPYDWKGGLGKIPLHLRYCSFCIPICFMLSLVTNINKLEHKKNAIIPFVVFLVLTVFPGAGIGYVAGESSHIDSVALSAYYTKNDAAGLIATAAMAIFTLYLILTVRKGWENSVNRVCMAFMLFFLLYNNAFAYINADPKVDRRMCEDAAEMNTIIGQNECLGITQQYYDDIYSYGLESRLNMPMYQVTNDQFYVEIVGKGGIYKPFVPIDQPPNIHSHQTPETSYFVLGQTIAEHMELNQSVDAQKTKHGFYTFAYVPENTRMLDTIFYGLDRNILRAGKQGKISVFDENRNIDGALILHIRAAGSGMLKIGNETIALTSAATTYDITVPFQNNIMINALEQDAQIFSYTTETK